MVNIPFGGVPPAESDAMPVNALLQPYSDVSEDRIDALRPELQRGLERALQDMPPELRQTLRITSGYRSPQDQYDILVRRFRAMGRPITPATLARGIPGYVAGVDVDANGVPISSHSQHANKVAVDINGSPAALNWLHHRGPAEYGFENPTYLRDTDPVHFQLVGSDLDSRVRNALAAKDATELSNLLGPAGDGFENTKNMRANDLEAFLGKTGSSSPASPNDLDVMARTILAEAGTDPTHQAAVGWVIRNRMGAGGFGDTPSAVSLARGQFEPWQNGRAQSVNPASKEYGQAYSIAKGVLSGDIPDPTEGATHFYSPSGQAALGRSAPAWASTYAPAGKFGDDVFFRDPKYGPPTKNPDRVIDFADASPEDKLTAAAFTPPRDPNSLIASKGGSSTNALAYAAPQNGLSLADRLRLLGSLNVAQVANIAPLSQPPNNVGGGAISPQNFIPYMHDNV